MAGKKITEFTDGGALQTGDSLLVARGGANFKIAGSQVANTASLTAATARISALENIGARVTAHRYWRVVVTAAQSTNNYTYMAELAMKATETGANLATGGTPIASGAYGAGTPISAAFDGNLDASTGKWESQQGATLSSGAVWIGYDFGRTVAIGAISITCGTYFENERPTRGRVDYSDDGTNWTPSWEWGPITWPTGLAVVTKTVVAPDPSAGLIPIKPPTATTFPTSINGTNADTAIVADANMMSIWRTDGGNTATNSHRVAGRVKPISGTSWSAKLMMRVPSVRVVGYGIRVGILVRDSTTGKMAIFGWNYIKSGNPALSGSNFDNTETLGLLIVSGGDIRHTETVSIRIDYNNGNFTMFASNNYGRSWITLGGNSVSFTPDQIGLGLSTFEGAPVGACSMDVLHYSDPDIV